MAETLALDHVSLLAKGPTLTLQVGPGQSLCVIGPGASGKSRLLAVISKRERPVRGSVHAPSRTSIAGRSELPWRAKPQAIARSRGGTNEAALAAEVLSGLRLWDVRLKPISQLSESQQAACELIEPLMSHAPLLVIDGQLDRLDPWALDGALHLLKDRLASGAAVVVATNRVDLASVFDTLVVLRDQAVEFAGTVADLLREGPEQTVEVETGRQPTVRALAEPFEVRVRETEEGLVFTTPEGQALAARLLLEGYGDVRMVLLKKPSLTEALLKLG